MKKGIAVFMAFLLAFALVGHAEVGYRHITNYQAKRLIAADIDLVIVDTRDIDDFEEKHIAGAINIPASTMNKAIAALPDKDQIIWFITENCGIDKNEVDKRSMKDF